MRPERFELWVIECRDGDGRLDFSAPQPHDVFGEGAIHGISSNRMADIIYRHKPDAVMTGDSVAHWPKLIDPRFSARRKTW